MSDLPHAVATWRDQIERTSERASPCRYLTPTQWATFRESAIDFCDRFGADALARTDRQMFWVHALHGTLRVDYCGALMIAGKKAQAVEADRVVFERTAGYRTTPGRAWGPPIWEFDAQAG